MRGKALLLGILTLVLATGVLVSQEVPPSDAGEKDAAVAQRRAALAQTGRYYLELLVSGQEIRLCHSGVWIARYPFKDLGAGYRRIALVPRGSAGDWIADLWPAGRLDPPAQQKRLKIIPGDETTSPTPGKADVIPPTLEELIPVPPLYFIRFEDGRAIEIILRGEIPGARLEVSTWRQRWNDFLAGLGLRPAEALRVRVTMDAKDGSALFRSLPQGPADLLVVP